MCCTISINFVEKIFLSHFSSKGLVFVNDNYPKYVKKMVKHVSVFARVSPKQKELVIVLLKSLGYVTLMCGDGTNDVGALKHADVGKLKIETKGFGIVFSLDS